MDIHGEYIWGSQPECRKTTKKYGDFTKGVAPNLPNSSTFLSLGTHDLGSQIFFRLSLGPRIGKNRQTYPLVNVHRTMILWKLTIFWANPTISMAMFNYFLKQFTVGYFIIT